MDCNNKQELDGFIYIDENGNNTNELNEKGIKRITVELQDLNGKVLQTTETIDTGRYVFTVCPDNYKIKATYTQGESSYLDRYEALVKKDSFTDDINFKVLKAEENSFMNYVLIGVFLLGFAAIVLMYKLFSKGTTNSL